MYGRASGSDKKNAPPSPLTMTKNIKFIQTEKLNTSILCYMIESRNNNNRKREAGTTRKLKEKDLQ